MSGEVRRRASEPPWSLADLEARRQRGEARARVAGEPLTIPGLHAASSPGPLLPRRVALRAKKSRRCRREILAGRPGILVKPKVSVLEGDASLRGGHGQWWNKDCSAVHVVPRVEIEQAYREGGGHALLLRVENPTFGSVSLSMGAVGEPPAAGTVLRDVVLDHLAGTRVAAAVVNSVADLSPTDVVRLGPSEDHFLEIVRRDPEPVLHWLADSRARISPSLEGQDAVANVLASRDDIAWLELFVADHASSSSKTTRCVAAPISLRIRVGDGSWESSSIKPLDDPLDSVAFSLILVWTMDAPTNP